MTRLTTAYLIRLPKCSTHYVELNRFAVVV
jgi:hypothetical protein